MDNYRFHLEKYHRGSKVACPECKRKACFTRYIDESGEITFPPHVGKCDHEHSCGYHYTPKDSFREHPDELDSFRQEWKPQAVTPKKPVSPPSFIDSAVMQRSLSHYDINPLYTFLSDTIGRSNTERLFKLYRVGTSKKWDGSAVFWQVDSNGQVHTGKIMGYDAKTGHRLKVPHPHVCWVHTELRLPGFNLCQCFFGEHLLVRYPDKTVFIVESEKTALIAAHFMPDGLWLATGGKNGCFNEKAVRILAHRDVVLMPDLVATEQWKQKTSMLANVCRSVSVSTVLEDMATDEQRARGLDIADFLLMEDTPQMILQRMIDRNPGLQTLIDELGLELVDAEQI